MAENLSICGYSGISSREQFKEYQFDAHFQCTGNFDDWLNDIVDVKALPFKDCAPIPSQILNEAFEWLKQHWDMGHKILISCAAGESRSVSISIGLLTLKAGFTFSEACAKVFANVPNAYPHPKTLVSVSKYIGCSINWEELHMIYNSIAIQPPFPWNNQDLVEALNQIEDMIK